MLLITRVLSIVLLTVKLSRGPGVQLLPAFSFGNRFPPNHHSRFKVAPALTQDKSEGQTIINSTPLEVSKGKLGCLHGKKPPNNRYMD